MASTPCTRFRSFTSPTTVCFIHIENRHQIRAQVSDVETTAVAVEALIIETRRAASQWHITQSAQRKLRRERSRTIIIGP